MIAQPMKHQFALGVDVGGTSSRWALMDSAGSDIAHGDGPGFSGAELLAPTGFDRVRQCVEQLASTVPAGADSVYAGVTGIGAGSAALQSIFARAFRLPDAAVSIASDVEIACRAAFTPGEGYLVYAGTGSIAAFIDETGALQRAGGRGVLLDDAGGGYWMAREALRRVWRREDESPGAWQHSPMAQRLFNAVGGDSSIFSARFLMERDRGEVGRLALIVAECAEVDGLARDILRDAGGELARLANAMVGRFGQRPVTIAGRAALMHELIQHAARARIAPDVPVNWRTLEAHVAAAKCAVERLRTNTTDKERQHGIS
ncbi:MAG: ATPase [Burkholderiales bacterium]|nr:ATPase [Burkholderiales bacterium]